MGRTKMTVTIDESLVLELDREAQARKQNRSRIVEEALYTWHRRQLERALIEGYQAMRQEDTDTAESHLEAGREALQ